MYSKEDILGKIKKDTNAIFDVHTHIGIGVNSYIGQGYPYCLSLEDLFIRMQALDIHYSVVFPHDTLFYELNRHAVKKVRVTTRICRFPYELENQHLMNEVFYIFPQYADKMLPFVMFDPMRKQKEQVKLFETLANKYPLYGLKTVTSGTQAYVKDLLTKKGRVILDFAKDLNIPVLLHSSVHPSDPWANALDILDIAEARPDVRFCLAHSARFHKGALDRAKGMDNCYVDLSAFHIHCQLAVSNSPSIGSGKDRFPSDYTKPVQALKEISEAYKDAVCWATDTPGYYFINRWVDEKGKENRSDLRCAWDTERNALSKLSSELVHQIAYTNPVRFLFGD